MRYAVTATSNARSAALVLALAAASEAAVPAPPGVESAGSAPGFRGVRAHHRPGVELADALGQAGPLEPSGHRPRGSRAPHPRGERRDRQPPPHRGAEARARRAMARERAPRRHRGPLGPPRGGRSFVLDRPLALASRRDRPGQRRGEGLSLAPRRASSTPPPRTCARCARAATECRGSACRASR